MPKVWEESPFPIKEVRHKKTRVLDTIKINPRTLCRKQSSTTLRTVIAINPHTYTHAHKTHTRTLFYICGNYICPGCWGNLCRSVIIISYSINTVYVCYEWTKFLLAVMYRAPRRHSDSSKTFKNIGRNWNTFLWPF